MCHHVMCYCAWDSDYSLSPSLLLSLGHVVRDSSTLAFSFSCTIIAAHSLPRPSASCMGFRTCICTRIRIRLGPSCLSVRRVFYPSALIVLPRLCQCHDTRRLFPCLAARAPRPHPTERSCYYAFLCHYGMHLLLLRLTIHVTLNSGFDLLMFRRCSVDFGRSVARWTKISIP